MEERRIDPSRLYHVRTSAGITQREVAERARISEYWYRLIEKGRRQPSKPVADDIALSLGVSLDAITEPTPVRKAA